MTTHTLTLHGRTPSKKNSKRRIKRGVNVFMVPSEAHDAWHTEQMLAIRREWSWGMIHPSAMTLTFYAPDKRKADLSNKTESVMDLLVDAGVIEDDSWFVIPDLHLKMAGIDRHAPRVVVQFD